MKLVANAKRTNVPFRIFERNVFLVLTTVSAHFAQPLYKKFTISEKDTTTDIKKSRFSAGFLST